MQLHTWSFLQINAQMVNKQDIILLLWTYWPTSALHWLIALTPCNKVHHVTYNTFIGDKCTRLPICIHLMSIYMQRLELSFLFSPGLSKDIQHPRALLCLQITQSDIWPHIKHSVSLVIAGGQLILLRFVMWPIASKFEVDCIFLVGLHYASFDDSLAWLSESVSPYISTNTREENQSGHMYICNHQADTHFTCGLIEVCSGDLQAKKRVWLDMTPSVLTETRCL